MKTPGAFLAVAVITVLSTGFFSSQKTDPPSRSSPKHDKVKTREIQADHHKVNVPVMATRQNISLLMKQKQAVFVHYGFAPLYNREFEKKYGVKILNKGCVVMPNDQKVARENNRLVGKFLTKTFGEGWKKELGLPLSGIQ